MPQGCDEEHICFTGYMYGAPRCDMQPCRWGVEVTKSPTFMVVE